MVFVTRKLADACYKEKTVANTIEQDRTELKSIQSVRHFPPGTIAIWVTLAAAWRFIQPTDAVYAREANKHIAADSVADRRYYLTQYDNWIYG